MPRRPELATPANTQVLAWLRGRNPGAPPFERPRDVALPYLTRGCHPDIVERLWEALNAVLPADGRGLVHGTPVLLEPGSGTILAIGIGTQYALRLPAGGLPQALVAGARTTTHWSGGTSLDVAAALGGAWVFGGWLASEPGWCRQAWTEAAGG